LDFFSCYSVIEIALTGQAASACFSQVSFATDAFLGCDLPPFISKEEGQIEAQAPQPMHKSLFTFILYAIKTRGNLFF
jgi:hypothetical protein